MSWQMKWKILGIQSATTKNRYDSMQSHNKWFGWMDGWLNGFCAAEAATTVPVPSVKAAAAVGALSIVLRY